MAKIKGVKKQYPESDHAQLNKLFFQMPGYEAALSQYKKGLINMSRQIQETITTVAGSVEAFRESVLKFAAIWEQTQKVNRETFGKQFDSMRGYLQKEGYIIPADYREFADWFFREKLGQTLIRPEDLVKLANVEPIDLWDFAKFKEAKFLDAIQEKERIAQEMTPFFYTVEGMEKAFRAAYLACLTHENRTWCYTGNKTHGVTIFWRAAVAAGLAKADAPASKVVPFLKDRFRLDSLGKNAIDKKKRIEEYDRELQEIHNKLLHLMGK